MSAPNDDDLDLVAAEYVLGTLEPDAARRFEDEMREEPLARRARQAWESRLAGLAAELTPVSPPPEVWQRVAERTGCSTGQASRTRPSVTPTARPGRRADMPPPAARRAGLAGLAGRWRVSALAAGAVAVVVAVALALTTFGGGSPSDDGPVYASLIHDYPTGSSWLVTEGSAAGNKLSIEAMNTYPLPKGKVLKLWVKPGNAGPMLVGTLPDTQGEYAMPISAAARQAMAENGQLVVSMEQSDFDADAPQGRIMWVSPIARRTS